MKYLSNKIKENLIAGLISMGVVIFPLVPIQLFSLYNSYLRNQERQEYMSKLPECMYQFNLEKLNMMSISDIERIYPDNTIGLVGILGECLHEGTIYTPTEFVREHTNYYYRKLVN